MCHSANNDIGFTIEQGSKLEQKDKVYIYCEINVYAIIIMIKQ